MQRNSPRAIFERLLFVIWLALTGASIGVTLLSPWFGIPGQGLTMLAAGGGGIVLATLLGSHGRARLHFKEHEQSIEFTNATGFGPLKDEQAEHLRRLFESWDELDGLRARGEVDVWRVQEIRCEAASLLEAHPQLRAEFAHELSRRPELGVR